MSTPNQPRTGLRPAHEFVPQDRFYPRHDVQASESAQAVLLDPEVAAQFDAYHGYPEVQQSILDEATERYNTSKSTQANETEETKVAITRSVATVEPLVFFWQRTGQFEDNLASIATNPEMYISAMQKHIGSLSIKQLIQFAPAIKAVAELADEDTAFELKLDLVHRASHLGVTTLESTVFNSAVALDQKQVA